MIRIISTTNGRALIEEARLIGKRAKTKTGRPAKRDMRLARELRAQARLTAPIQHTAEGEPQ